MKKIIIAVLVLLVIGGGVWFAKNGGMGQEVSKVDAIDTVGGFYDQWLLATKQPEAVPNRATLAKSPILSKELRKKLGEALKQTESTLDPVLCQATVPEDISLRQVSETAEKAEILVTARNSKATEQAIIILQKLNEGWYINEINCSLGEFEPEREFTFEKEGFLLKDSVPAPYDAKNWHIVFEQNGTAGHVAPLFFDGESQCTALSGNVSQCNPAQFAEATKVLVKGQMSERGVSVKQLLFVKE